MARPNGVREAWQQSRVVINSWLGIPSSFSAEVMASMGWDSLVVDMQHGMIGRCQGCGESTALFPLHGEKGGPVRCPLCLGKWHAEHGRRRNRGRIVIRAIKGYLDGGGKWDDVDKLKLAAAGTDLFDLDPLGYMAGTAKICGDIISPIEDAGWTGDDENI